MKEYKAYFFLFVSSITSYVRNMDRKLPMLNNKQLIQH